MGPRGEAGRWGSLWGHPKTSCCACRVETCQQEKLHTPFSCLEAVPPTVSPGDTPTPSRAPLLSKDQSPGNGPAFQSEPAHSHGPCPPHHLGTLSAPGVFCF